MTLSDTLLTRGGALFVADGAIVQGRIVAVAVVRGKRTRQWLAAWPAIS